MPFTTSETPGEISSMQKYKKCCLRILPYLKKITTFAWIYEKELNLNIFLKNYEHN
jgi:hypothetical protein